mgnify:CR=1 FL=1
MKHLAIIPDGNRRWARERGLTVQDGHRAGIRAIDDAIRVAFDHGVEVVTFWWGSPANLTQRAPDEVRGIVEAHRAGTFEIRPEDQDVHLAVERTLTEQLGDLGKRIRDVRVSADGYVYVLTDEDDGQLLELVPPAAP